jgi:hypothetical protein
MTVREWLAAHPGAIVADGMIGEGYGDGWLSVEDALDEEVRNSYYNEKTKEAEIYI